MTLSCDEKRARLERALHQGGDTHSVADVVAMCKDGRAQFWSRDDGVIITEINEYPRCKMVHFWLVAGELHDCLALDVEVSRWATGRGCTQATAMGRPGWARAAAANGWRLWYPNFIKDLPAAEHRLPTVNGSADHAVV
jgi:hypothetical protein